MGVLMGMTRDIVRPTGLRKGISGTAAAVALALAQGSAVAQTIDDSDDTQAIEEIVVTGSRLMRRDFSGTDADLVLTHLTLNTTGDSLTFNSRGLLSTGTARATLGRRDRSHAGVVNGLGRTTLN